MSSKGKEAENKALDLVDFGDDKLDHPRAKWDIEWAAAADRPVSYTHLTLPTKA